MEHLTIEFKNNEILYGQPLNDVVSKINDIIDLVSEGYILKEVISTDITPTTSGAANIFYLATEGTYTHFGTSIDIPSGSIGIFKWNGSAWDRKVAKVCDPVSVSQNTLTIGGQPTDIKVVEVEEDVVTGKQQLLIGGLPSLVVDKVPTLDSHNLVESGGVQDSINKSVSKIQDILPEQADTFYVVDYAGNIIAVIDKNGVKSTGYAQPTAKTIESGKNGIKICDSQGNIVFMLTDGFTFGDNMIQFAVAEYNKPAVSWIDDDFQIFDNNNELAPEYEMVHNWCMANDIRLDFAYIPSLYQGTSQFQERIDIANEWQRESFTFLLHPDHDGWFNSSGGYVNVYDLDKVRASIIDAIKCFRENYFVSGDNILVYPGSSYNFPDIVNLIKNYVECAITATEDETNHITNNGRYNFKRYSIVFSSVKTKTKIKQELANFIANGDWVILETHLYNYRNDLETLDETSNSVANVLDVVNYVNGLCPLESTARVWRKRKFMFDMSNK